MKFIVAVDLEGVACAYAPCGSSIENAFNIEFIRKQATKEADAAVRALFDSGANEVIVWDNHGRGCSLDYDNLDKRCRIAIGADSKSRYPVLDESFSGVLLLVIMQWLLIEKVQCPILFRVKTISPLK